MADALAQLIVKIMGDASSLDKETKKAMRVLDDFSSKSTSVGRMLTAGVTLPMAGVAAAALKIAGETEQTTLAFKTMLGSAEAAGKHLKDLKQFALTTPFQFNELTAASRRMQALGWSAQQVLPDLRIIGDTASGLALGAEGVNRITLALGQMRMSGRVTTEDMRQLVDVGVDAWGILAKTLHTDVAGAMKLVEKRAVESATAVPAILAGMNAKFGGLMAAQAQTMLGSWSNLADKGVEVLGKFGDAIRPTATKTIQFFDAAADGAVKLATEFQKLPQPIQSSTLAMAGLAAAAGPALLVMGQLAGSLKAVREAWPIVAGMAAAGAVPTAVLGASAAGAMADAHTNAARGNTASVATAADRQIDAMVKAQMEHAKSIEALNAVRLKAAPVDQAAFELSIKQAEAHKKGGIAVAAIATATKEAAEELRLATWAEAVQMETRQRGNAAAKSAVSVISDLVNAGEAWGKKLEYMTATQKDSYLSLDFLRRSADGVVDAMRDLIRPSDTLLSIMGALGPKVSTAEDAFEALGIRSQASLNTAVVKARDALNILTEMYRIGKASPEDLMRAQDALRRAQEAAGQGGGQRGRQSPLLQISTIVTDFSRAISDVIFQAKSFGDAMKQVGQSILQSLVRGLVETGVSKAVGALGKLASSSGALGKVLGSIFGGIGGSAAGSAAGSIVGSTAGTAVGGAIGSAAGGAAGGAASGATSAAASGLTGAINLVTGAVSAVANVVQAFQLAHIGKDTGRMEESLRGILNVLALNGGESIHHFAKQSMFANVEVRDYWRTTGHSLLVQMTSSLETMVTRGTSAVTAGGPPITINIYNAQFTDAASLDRQLNEMGRRLREVTGYRR